MLALGSLAAIWDGLNDAGQAVERHMPTLDVLPVARQQVRHVHLPAVRSRHRLRDERRLLGQRVRPGAARVAAVAQDDQPTVTGPAECPHTRGERALTASLGAGAHTTTFSRFYRLDRDTAIIDTPGFQSFGLFHLTEDQIGEAMREFRPYLGRCKFNDCSHLSEPGCEVIEASKRGEISRERLSFYQVLIEQHRDLHEQHPEWTR